MADLLIATGNAHKVGEIQAILPDLPVTWHTTREFAAMEVVEDGPDYRANALIKARAWALQTGLSTIADDSGLEVEALDGRPGLYSARYAGPGENPITKLLSEMDSVPEAKRAARFVCAACLCSPNGEAFFAEGELRGAIAFAPAGTGGFGFDPVFLPEADPKKRCLAEYAEDEKNAISHRGRAFRVIRPLIESHLLEPKA